MPSAMLTIDRDGRVVTPEEVRDQLALENDSELGLPTDGDGIRLTPLRRPGRAVIEDHGRPVLVRPDAVSTTDADVQRWRDAEQR